MPKADAIDRLTDTLVVYDGLMDEADERLTGIFTRGSHHRNVLVIFMAQNFFNKKPSHANDQSECTVHRTV